MKKTTSDIWELKRLLKLKRDEQLPKRTQEKTKKGVKERSWSMRTYWPKKDFKLPKRATTDSKEEKKCIQKKEDK